MADDRTFAERLDAATDGPEFAAVLNNIFTYLAKARDEEEADK